VPALRGEFVAWDDTTNFVNNPSYRGLGPSELWWMLTSVDGVWIPLTWVTLGLDYVLWGMQPAGYHLTSLLLHAIAAALAYFVALHLLKAAAPAPPPRVALRFAAASAALLFAVHPLRAESVAWITERRDVLCGVCFLLAVLCYLRWVDAGGGWYWASLGAAAAALLAKPAAAPLPAVLLVLDAYPLRRLAGWTTPAARRVWREKAPFVALSAGAAVMAIVAQRAAGALSSAGTLDLGQRLALSAWALVFYVEKTLVPLALSPLYEMPQRFDPTSPRAIASAALVVAAAVTVWLLHRRLPALAAGAAVFTLLLLPTLGLVHYGPHLAADRNTYLASLAPALLAGGLLVRAWHARTKVVPVALAVLLVLGVLTWRQSGTWHDSETLWRHALHVSPSAIGYTQLGTVLMEAGRPAEALPYFAEAVRLRPDFATAYNNWGLALGHLRRFDEAKERFETALRLRPGYRDAEYNLGLLRAARGATPLRPPGAVR
jgi:tetratricopeptide (TPR) repeat protein